jgi:hypothetical protein
MRFDAEQARSEVQRVVQVAEMTPLTLELQQEVSAGYVSYRAAFSNNIPVDLRISLIHREYRPGVFVRHLMVTHRSLMSIERPVMLDICRAAGLPDPKMFDTTTLGGVIMTHGVAPVSGDWHSNIAMTKLIDEIAETATRPEGALV